MICAIKYSQKLFKAQRFSGKTMRPENEPRHPQRELFQIDQGAEIHWGAETWSRSDDVRGRGYAPKGETLVLRIKNNLSSLSVISTVTNKGQMRWRIFSSALYARILIDFLKRRTRNAAMD